MVMAMQRYPTARGRKETIEWSANLADWNIAATTTHPHHSINRTTMYGQELALKAHGYVLNRLNKAIFGHGAQRKGLTIGVCGVHGLGQYGTAPHTHLAYAFPKSMAYDDSSKLLKHLYKSTHGIAQQTDIQPYNGPRWWEYTTDPKKHQLLPQLCVKPNFGNC
jgi:hypothetical protein